MPAPTSAPASPADAVGGAAGPLRGRARAQRSEAAALLAPPPRLGLTVVPRGAGSRLDWGAAPASCDLIVDTRRLDRVIEHAAGDLVVSVQAGVRADDLADSARTPPASGWRLTRPARRGTVGGLIATGAAGPLRYRYGSPRDLLIGITIVRPDGTVAKSGGKVVKNVAGYDLGKLFAGSLGTLGLITEATFRLHPLPAAAAWLTLDCPDAAVGGHGRPRDRGLAARARGDRARLAVRGRPDLRLGAARRRRRPASPSALAA